MFKGQIAKEKQAKKERCSCLQLSDFQWGFIAGALFMNFVQFIIAALL